MKKLSQQFDIFYPPHLGKSHQQDGIELAFWADGPKIYPLTSRCEKATTPEYINSVENNLYFILQLGPLWMMFLYIAQYSYGHKHTFALYSNGCRLL